MKRTASTILIVVLLLTATAAVVWADKPVAFDSQGNETGWRSTCPGGTRIQDGVLTYSTGHYLYGTPLQVGYDPYGYNYQAHQFNGSYADVYLGRDGLPPYDGDDDAYLAENPGAASKWYWPYRQVDLVMKWSDEWLANTDCNGDGDLDRHQGFDSYIGSGAWETNHQSGTDVLDDGTTCHWTYFVKIIAVPAGAYYIDENNNSKPDDDTEYWYTTDGGEIGPSIWGEFAAIERVYNDPCGGYHGIEYLSPDHVGFGGW